MARKPTSRPSASAFAGAFAELEAERERDRARLAELERQRDYLREEVEGFLRHAIEEGPWYTIDDIIADLERSAKDSQA